MKVWKRGSKDQGKKYGRKVARNQTRIYAQNLARNQSIKYQESSKKLGKKVCTKMQQGTGQESLQEN